MLWQGEDIRIEVAHAYLHIVHLGVIRSHARHQTGTGRPADRLLTIIRQEDSTGSRQPVDVRRPGDATAISADLRFQIINGDEEDVGTLFLR